MVLPFFTELKNLRQAREIDLVEVANRTKINLDYLESLESGDFSFLPTVYIRLFLRAYALEIGADADDVLKQLDIHLAKTEEPSPAEPARVEEESEDEKEEDYDVSRKTSFQIRSDIIKVAALVVVVLFAIFIIRKIVSEEPIAPSEITDEILSASYSGELSAKTFPVSPPYRFTLHATAPLWYRYAMDGGPFRSGTLDRLEELTRGFQSEFQLRVDRLANLELLVNDRPVTFQPTSHPGDFSFQSENSELTVTRYRLK